MTKRLSALIAVVCLLTWPVMSSAKAGEAQQRPNIMVILVDDMNDVAGFAGGQAITPNLDRAARAGLVFTNMQAAATFCTPSRSALMTGVSPARSGNYRNQPALYTTPQYQTFVAELARNGYAAFGGGKVFHHTAGYLDQRGYSEYYLWNPDNRAKGWALLPWGKKAPTPKRPVTQIPVYTGWSEFDIAQLPDEAEGQMADTMTARWAAGVVSQAHDKPFVLTVGFYAPHKPNYVPKKYFDLYKSKRIRLPDVYAKDLDDLPGDPHLKPLCCVSPVKPTIGSGAWPAHREIVAHKDWETALRGYLASVSYADAQAGVVLEALRNGPNKDNTLVVFLSDNGYHLGEKDKWAKHSLWQRTTNIPFFVMGPGVREGRYDGAASLLDVMPTVLASAGVRSGQPQDGANLWPVLRGARSGATRLVVTSGNRGEFAVTGKDYRYILYSDGGEELYDRRRDPHEWRNLADDPKFSTIKNTMRMALPKTWAAEGLSPEMRQIRLVIDGQAFHWEVGASTGEGEKEE